MGIHRFYFCSFLIFLSYFIYPLDRIYVQADELDKSVLEVFQSLDGQGSSNEVDEKESSILSEELIPLTTMEEQSLFGIFFQLFLALAFIILLIYGLIRFIGKKSQSYQTHRTLQNIGGVHVGSNRSIQLVRVGERVLVVGVGETIQLLKEIDNEQEVKKILEDYDIQEGQQQFSLLYGWLQKKINNNKANETSNGYFQGLLQRQLSDVKDSQKKAHAAIKEREQ